MGVRRNTTNRWTLFRPCAVCGKQIVTTADTPFVRSVREGDRQITRYYCSESCKLASYKHKFDGKAEERRKERESRRDRSAWWKRYYAEHGEQKREKERQRRSAMSAEERSAEGRYYRKKRTLLEAAENGG